MSDPASTDLIRFARSPTFRDRIRYISADSRCKNVWRLSTTVPSYFPHYKGFSSFLDTETIRVISCILFQEDLAASIRHILGDVQVERLWLLGRAIDAVQAVKCRIPEWAAAAPALLTLADHQHELVGLGERRTQHFDHVMWYTKAALMLANDHLPANEQLDWNRPEYALSLYLYLKKEQGVCLCDHREGLNHSSCCATLFKLYSLPIEAWWDANISLFSETDPNARPRTELKGLMGKLGASGYPMLPPRVDHDVRRAPDHSQQIPNAPKAFRSGTNSPSAPTTTPDSPISARSVSTPSLHSKQPPNAPRALMHRRIPPLPQPRRPPTPQHNQSITPSSTGRQLIPSNDYTKSTSMMPTTQHQLPPRPSTFEPPPRRYYGRSGVYVGRRQTYPIAEAMGKPVSYSTSPWEHSQHSQHSYPPLNQYIMQQHPPRPVGYSSEPSHTESRTSEIIVTLDRLQSVTRTRDLTHHPLHLTHTSTLAFNRSLSSSVVRPSANSTTTVHNRKTADSDEGQPRRVEKWMGGDGGCKLYSHSRSISSDPSVAEVIAQSPESGEADMEVDDPDSHLGMILAVAEDPPKQPMNGVEEDRDLQPDKDGSGGRTLKRVTPTIGSWLTGVGSGRDATQMEQQTLAGRPDTGAERGDITPPTLNGGSARAKSVEKTAAQVLLPSQNQKSDDHTNDNKDASEEGVCHPVPDKSGSIPWWISSKPGKVVNLLCDESHRGQKSTVMEPQPDLTVNQTVVTLDSDGACTENGDRLNASEGNGRNAEVVDAGNHLDAAAVVTQTVASPKNTLSVSDKQELELTPQPTPTIAVKGAVALGPCPVESPIRRSTRSSLGLLKKKSYAESSEDERVSVGRSNPGSGSRGAGCQTAKQKRNEASVRVHTSTPGTKATIPVPDADQRVVTVAASASTPTKMPDWEIQLRNLPNWEFELEMWKERELFRYHSTGNWDHRPFNVESPQEKRCQAEVAKLRVDGNPVPTNQLGCNLPWETGIEFNSPHSTGSNQSLTSGNAAQGTENTVVPTLILPSKPPIPAPASFQKKASASMAKTTVQASSALSRRRIRVTKNPTPIPKGPTVDGKEGGLGVGFVPSTRSPSKPKSTILVGQPSTQRVTDLPTNQPQGTNGVIDLNDDELENNQPKESPAMDRTGGPYRARLAASRKRKENLSRDVEGISSSRKKRKMDVDAGSTPTSAGAAVGSTLSNMRRGLEGAIVLSSGDARLCQNRLLSKTTTRNLPHIDVLSTPADTTTGSHTPLNPDLPSAGKVGEKQAPMSSLVRTEAPQVMAVAEGSVITTTTTTTSALQSDQYVQMGHFLQGTPPTSAAKKCLALRFFDSQLGRRRDDGEAEKTRLLDAISWLTDLALDANKAEVGAGGIVFKGEYAENLVTKLDEKIPITLWRKGLRLVIELADGTTTSLEPIATQTHANGPVNHLSSNSLPTGTPELSHFPKERPINPATHWPVLAFCASNRRMIMDEPKQEAERIIHLLNAFCNVQLEEKDWTLEEAFSRKAEDGSEIVVPRVTIVTAHAREKVFTAFSPKATKKLAKSNILIFTDDEPFLWKPELSNFGSLRTIPSTIETAPPFVSVSIPSIHPKPVFKPHCWVSSHEAPTVLPLAFYNMGDYERGAYQYCCEPLVPMNEGDWRDMARPLKFEF